MKSRRRNLRWVDIEMAERLGVKAPLNEGLLCITQQMAINHELPGKYMPAGLLQLPGLD